MFQPVLKALERPAALHSQARIRGGQFFWGISHTTPLIRARGPRSRPCEKQCARFMGLQIPEMPAVDRSETAEAAKVFALLYAVAVLLHILWPPVFQPGSAIAVPAIWLLTGLVLSAVAVIHRPASVGRLLCLASGQLLDVAYYLPFVPNHWLLTGILSLAILGAAAAVSLSDGRPAVQLGAVYQTLTPSVRISAAIFYFFTFFHKLNS